MKKIVITNFDDFKDIVDTPERIEKVSQGLSKEVDQTNPQESLLIQYKGFPEHGETGHCEFSLVGVNGNEIQYEFIGTIS